MPLTIGLVSYQFIDNDIEYNIKQIEKALIQNQRADLLCFGETFLQGFSSLNWNYENDKLIAIAKDSIIMHQLERLSASYKTDIAFGYIEIEGDKLYSSYAVIIEGVLRYNYRRMSVGWKEYWKTNEHYSEGTEVLNFKYKDKLITIALCGDLWVMPEKFKTDGIILWPVYVNFSIDEWAYEEMEYAFQAQLAANDTLMVNSISKDPDSHGGSFYFKNGHIKEKIAYDIEDILYVEI